MERWPIRLHPQAKVEIKAAVRWYRDINQSLSGEFSDSLDVAIGRIARSPRQWPVYVDEFRHVRLNRGHPAVLPRLPELCSNHPHPFATSFPSSGLGTPFLEALLRWARVDVHSLQNLSA